MIRHFLRAMVCTGVAAFALGLAPTVAQAATKAFIDLNGTTAPLAGEKSATKAGWIEVTSYTWGMSKGTTPGSSTGGAGAGKGGPVSYTGKSAAVVAGKVPPTKSLNVTLSDPSDAMKLMRLAIDGKTIPTVHLVAYNVTSKGMVPTYDVVFNDVIVTSDEWTGKDDKPSAKVSLVYKTIQVAANTKAPKTEDPTIPTGWNRVNNTTDPDLTEVPVIGP